MTSTRVAPVPGLPGPTPGAAVPDSPAPLPAVQGRTGREGRRSTTPRFLRAMLAAAVCLVVAFVVAVAAVLAGSLARIAAAQDAATDYLRLGETRAALARADVAATDWLLDPSAANRTAVGEALTSALQNSAISDPASESDLAGLHAAVVRYGMALQAAFDATGGAAGDKVAAARALRAGEVTSALDAVAARRLDAIGGALTDDLGWAIPLAGTLAVLGLIVVSYFLARRLRRVVNLGVAGALVAVVVVWVVATSGLGGSATTATALARGAADLQRGLTARALVTGSLAITGQELAQPGSVGSLDGARQGTLSKARTAVSGLAAPGKLAGLLADAGDTQTRVEDAVKANRLTDAKALLPAARTSAKTFDDAARNAVTSVNAQIGSALGGQRTTVVAAIVAAGVLAALGVVALVIGLGQRLREYR